MSSNSPFHNNSLTTRDSPHMTRDLTRESPHSLTDADSALGASTSPDLRQDEFSDEREENFECFGENDAKEYESDVTNQRSSPTPLVRRHSWLRTSLRRTSPNTDTLVPPKRWGSFRTPRQRSSAALASALYSSGPATGSFNSSGRSSNCDDGEMQDMHSDISIEDDVIDLNNKVQQLQEQVGQLAESQATTDDRYTRVKQDNAALTARIHMLEEHIRELEVRGEERVEEEQRRSRELMQRLERERQLEVENYSIRLQAAEREGKGLGDEVSSLRATVEKVRAEKAGVEEQLAEVQNLLVREQEAHRGLQEVVGREREEWAGEREASAHLIQELSREVEESRRDAEERRSRSRGVVVEEDGVDHQVLDEVSGEMPARIADMEAEIRTLREANKRCHENNEELQAAMLNKGLEEGRSLLNNPQHTNSLAAEFEAMSENEMRKALKDQQDVNLHLRSYIDNVLMNIMEKHPELLEIRSKK